MTTIADLVPVAIVAAVSLTLPAAPAAQTQDARTPLEALIEGPLGGLKQAYLACSEAALDQALGRSGAVACSTIYEALKRRAFDGDFERLLVWSRRAHAERSALTSAAALEGP
jgi:hypothetical protein